MMGKRLGRLFRGWTAAAAALLLALCAFALAEKEVPAAGSLVRAVRIVWEDGLNRDGIRPLVLKVSLLADGEKVETLTLNADNHWTGVVTGLDGERDGVPILYTWEETPVEPMKYRCESITEKGSLTFITNRYEPARLNIGAMAVWPETLPGDMPESVTVQLFADGVAAGSPRELNAENEWRAVWKGLPRYANGTHLSGKQHEIRYTLEETEIPEGFEARVRKIKSRSFLIEHMAVMH